ncbi:MAG: cryptochrome/photolyase family protein, partial [Planctomycetota bacterium]
MFEDQLHPKATALAEAPSDAPVFMVESHTHNSAWPFHKKRLAFLIAAMRHFAVELEEAGRQVAHYPLKPRGYRDSLSALADHLEDRDNRELWITEPSEWHTRNWLETVPERLADEFGIDDVTLKFFPNRLFLTDRQHFAKWLAGRKRPTMEHFYRQARVEHELLMDDDGKPAGGEWNFDKMNRKAAPKGHKFPEVGTFQPDAITKAVIKEVDRRYADHPGELDDFALPVTRADAKKAFNEFVKNRLPLFGEYEDAMVTGEGAMYHSLISPLVNAGLIEPLAMCRQVEKAFCKGDAPINAAEGFIRQIIGWREFVYGIYWSLMP